MTLTELDGSLAHVLQANRRYYEAEQAEIVLNKLPHGEHHAGFAAKAEKRTMAAAMVLDATVDEYHAQIRDFIKQEIMAAVAAMTHEQAA
jgi:hypothetical protein